MAGEIYEGHIRDSQGRPQPIAVPAGLDGSGNPQALYSGGNAYATTQDCTAANTNYDIDANANLVRNGRWGFVKSATTNTGVVSVALSANGTTFTAFIGDIQPGDVISLDGMDIDTVRVKSTVAGDDVIVEVH